MNWQTRERHHLDHQPNVAVRSSLWRSSKTEGMKTPATLDGGPSMLELYGIPGLPTTRRSPAD